MSSNRVELSQDILLAALGDSWPAEEVSAAAELLSGGEGQFPSGIRSLPSDLVAAVQRERLLAAMLRATSELAYREVSVQDVLDRAGVSRPTFYEHFENKEDCFLAAFDSAAARLRKRLEAAAEGGETWRDRLRAALAELLRFVGEDPDAAMSLIVDARAACPAALLRRDELLDRFASCLDTEVRAEADPGEPPSAIAAAGIVGGIESLLYSRLYRGETAGLESLLPSLMYFAVLPYGGHEAAGEELAVVAAG
ncbi:MAG TPA: TetR/AcrR family transcriptional regulator [Solirubrobacterales bacterium]|jgi:AcrR family transcriptional regulator|nr:TetR/AcrR family transcriptional regulator [Solirubrobacterales bacterium]